MRSRLKAGEGCATREEAGREGGVTTGTGVLLVPCSRALQVVGDPGAFRKRRGRHRGYGGADVREWAPPPAPLPRQVAHACQLRAVADLSISASKTWILDLRYSALCAPTYQNQI